MAAGRLQVNTSLFTHLPRNLPPAAINSYATQDGPNLQAIALLISTWDDRTLLWLNQFMFRWPWLYRGSKWLVGGEGHIVKFVPIVLVICWLWFKPEPRRKWLRPLLLDALTSGVVALVVGRVLALALPFRDRPFSRGDLAFALPDVENGLRTWSSFPSDHAVLAFALAASLARISPGMGLCIGIHSLVIVCLPRIYLGLHYPSDVAGGALIGATCAWAVSSLAARSTLNRSLMEIERTRPAAFYTAGFLLLFSITEMFNGFRTLAVFFFRMLRPVFG